jgi:hypothetical protein
MQCPRYQQDSARESGSLSLPGLSVRLDSPDAYPSRHTLENDRPSDLALWRQLEFRKACGAHAKGETEI